MAFKQWLIACAFIASFCCNSATFCTRDSTICDTSHVCCANQCVYGTTCYDRICSYDTDCSLGETCCNNQCSDGYSCIGHTCSLDSHCSGIEVCCSGVCQYSCYWTHVAIVSTIVFSTLFLFGLIMVVVICFRRRRQATNQPQIITGNTNYPAYYPPLQGQPYYSLPPPQYGAINPPSYEVTVVDTEAVPNIVGGEDTVKNI